MGTKMIGSKTWLAIICFIFILLLVGIFYIWPSIQRPTTPPLISEGLSSKFDPEKYTNKESNFIVEIMNLMLEKLKQKEGQRSP